MAENSQDEAPADGMNSHQCELLLERQISMSVPGTSRSIPFQQHNSKAGYAFSADGYLKKGGQFSLIHVSETWSRILGPNRPRLSTHRYVWAPGDVLRADLPADLV
jgi:hypothetical protein